MDTEIDKDEMDWDKNNEKTEDHEFFAPTKVVEHNHKRKELENLEKEQTEILTLLNG